MLTDTIQHNNKLMLFVTDLIFCNKHPGGISPMQHSIPDRTYQKLIDDWIFIQNVSSFAHFTHSLTNLSSHCQALWVGDGGELLVPQPLDGVLVISQIQLGAHQDDGCVGAVVSHLRVPLGHHTHKCTRSYAYTKDKVRERGEGEELVGHRGRAMSTFKQWHSARLCELF